MKTVTKYYRMDRREIGFLRFIMDAYEGIAVIETIDAGSGLIALHIPPGCEPEVEMVLADLKQQILIVPEIPQGEDI
ncbi:DUF4911 domain-containing protein [Desulfonema ishimotonii]|uniref:DUF4911 domain-containing protein n=1 Tax=Desulfonema ishimotonii TaxID=45657 RepID=A0A401FXM9_9BACT|nr:DUF4911 domain-containing protein [Desulfonema ishimotonii]GBC61699.1 DUF4911 domain-containing protein [Desulfonema ishimotonii]